MTVQDDLKTILVHFTYSGIMGHMTKANYVIWDSKGFPIQLAGKELKDIIRNELAKLGMSFERHNKHIVRA